MFPGPELGTDEVEHWKPGGSAMLAILRIQAWIIHQDDQIWPGALQKTLDALLHSPKEKTCFSTSTKPITAKRLKDTETSAPKPASWDRRCLLDG
jgi:hypothetical protein